MLTRLAILAGLLVAAAGIAIAGDTPRVEVPQVDWYDLVPYLRVNVNITYEGGHTQFGSFSVPNRDMFPENYNPVLDEIAKVLVLESLDDRRVYDAVAEVVKALGTPDRPASLTPRENNERFWQRLAAGGDYLRNVRRFFEKAKASGTMNCTECAHGFTFEALRVIP